jgi:hypothetical protein
MPATLLRQNRLSLSAIAKPDLTWRHLQIASKDGSEPSSRGDKVLVSLREVEPLCPLSLIRRKALLKAVQARRAENERGSPYMNLTSIQCRNIRGRTP